MLKLNDKTRTENLCQSVNVCSVNDLQKSIDSGKLPRDWKDAFISPVFRAFI
ncbi:hypothetical protein DPMN_120857 [Dreissena polymorpha]|uniref:Uncharacterized protein n=1 Tax=Dreissena polymorpha TaxID=45954 RepID=A0A9D4JQJ1_DREPO|nr:hypothetical protein DPMN_120857 [Dreissena polymorpha]